MAQNNGDWDFLANRFAQSLDKHDNGIVYCELCGRQILRYSGQDEMFKWEVVNKVHAECAQKYRDEMIQKQRAEAEKARQNEV